MPAIANLTVKKFDGVTDIVYDALSGSGGDGSPAVWRQDTGMSTSVPFGLRSIFKLWTMWNGPKTARQTKINFVSPYAVQDTTTSLYSAKDRVVVDIIVTAPQAIPPAFINEAVYQACNLVAHSSTKASAANGYAPT